MWANESERSREKLSTEQTQIIAQIFKMRFGKKYMVCPLDSVLLLWIENLEIGETLKMAVFLCKKVNTQRDC